MLPSCDRSKKMLQYKYPISYTHIHMEHTFHLSRPVRLLTYNGGVLVLELL